MGERINLAPAFQRVLAPPSDPATGNTPLNVTVVFTSVAATIAALRHAGALAHRLHARIVLIAPQVVPYPLPLETPPVLLDFNERRFRVIASESPVETSVQIYLCRDRFETLISVLAPRSLVVIGGRRRWWRTREEGLAWKMRRAGHEVIFTEVE
jgi:hypothetical protein